MTDIDPAADLDSLFGFKELPVGLGDLKLKVRVMLTRKQVKASAALYQRMIAAHDKLTTMIANAQEAPDAAAMVGLTEQGEEVEDELAEICVRGLSILCIKPPVEILEQMQIADLAGLFARANAEQGVVAAETITGQSGHPTPASSAS